MAPGLAVLDGEIVGVCGDGRMLSISSLRDGAAEVSPQQLQSMLARSAAKIDIT